MCRYVNANHSFLITHVNPRISILIAIGISDTKIDTITIRRDRIKNARLIINMYEISVSISSSTTSIVRVSIDFYRCEEAAALHLTSTAITLYREIECIVR